MAESKGLVWKIALGAFLGVTAFGLATCGVVGALGLGYMKNRADAADEAMKMLNEGRDDEALNLDARMTEIRNAQKASRMRPREQQRQNVPLKDDERCVGATRVRRVNNGWEQSGSCP